MILAILALVGWFVVSEASAAVICWDVDPKEYNSDMVQLIRVGVFMLPAILPMILLTYATWHLVRFANYMRLPLVEPASDNPMDYL